MNTINVRQTLIDTLRKATGSKNLVALDGEGTVPESISEGAIGIAFVEDIDTVSSYVLEIRTNGSQLIASLPIILVGYISLGKLLQSEERPKLITSEGVHYLELPASIEKIKSTIENAQNLPVSHPMWAVKKCLLSSEEQTKEERTIAHSLGNFLGSETLLYGAYLCNRLSFEKFQFEVANIENVQSEYCRENCLSDYAIYKLGKPDYKAETGLPRQSKVDSTMKGKILLIDDFAHLGWSTAIAYSLWGRGSSEFGKSSKVEDGLIVDVFTLGASQLYSISRDKETAEDGFVHKLKQKLKANFMNGFDVILLDLRLKWKRDESIDDPSRMSGFAILQKIRADNAAIPVIIFTASRQARNMEKVLDLGADDYFVKEYKSTSADEAGHCSAFAQKVKNAISRSFLGAAWSVIEDIEKIYAKDQHKDEMVYIKKAIALLKKKPVKFEQDVMGLDFVNEAMVALGDAVQLKQDRRNQVRDGHAFAETLDGGYLLRGLRNLAAHPSGEKLDLDDMKIAFYLLFRLYTKDEDVLENYVERAFGDIYKEEPRTVLFESCLRLLKMIPDFDFLNSPLERSKSDNDKLLHYLYFLCRLKSPKKDILRYDQYKHCDKVVLSHIFGKIEIMPKIGKNLTGQIEIVKGDRGAPVPFIKPDAYRGKIHELDKSTARDLFSLHPIKVVFELEWIRSSIGAKYIRRA